MPDTKEDEKKKSTKKPDEKEKAAKDAKREAAEKKKSLTDYEKRLVNAKQLKKMTDTDAWRQLYKSIKSQIAAHAEGVLDHTLSGKEIMYHQQSVRVLRDILNTVRAPMDAVTSYEKEMPLFAASEIKERAEWDDKTGTVTIK